MAAPTISLTTTGTDPKDITKQELETKVNAALAVNDANAESRLLKADNLSDVASAATARTNLGVEIGADVQAHDALLDAVAGLSMVADRYVYGTGTDTVALGTVTAFGRSVLDDADAATARTTLGVAIGSDVQAYDASLASFAGLATAADKLAYSTGVDTWAEADITLKGRTLLAQATAAEMKTQLELGNVTNTSDAAKPVSTAQQTALDAKLAIASNLSDLANAATSRANLGVEIGADVQGYDAALASFAGLATAADKIAYSTGVDTWAEADITLKGRTLLAQSTAAEMKTQLELGNVTNTSDAAKPVSTAQQTALDTKLTAASNLSDLADAATARTNLGVAIGSDVQAYDASLASFAGLATAADKLAYSTGVDTWAETDITLKGRTLLAQSTAADMQTQIGVDDYVSDSEVYIGGGTSLRLRGNDNRAIVGTGAGGAILWSIDRSGRFEGFGDFEVRGPLNIPTGHGLKIEDTKTGRVALALGVGGAVLADHAPAKTEYHLRRHLDAYGLPKDTHFRAESLSKAWASFARAAMGGGQARIAYMGDSWFGNEGGVEYLSRYARRLIGGDAPGLSNFHQNDRNTATGDDLIDFTGLGAWTKLGVAGSTGLNSTGMSAAATGTSFDIDYSFGFGFDTMYLYYEPNTGASIDVSVDGGAATTYDLSVGTGSARIAIDVSARSTGSGTITITTKTDDAVILNAVDLYHSTQPGLTFADLGIGGSDTGQWLAAIQDATWAARYAEVAPECTVVNLLGNDQVDARAITPEGTRTNIRSIIRAIRAALSDPTHPILWIIQPQAIPERGTTAMKEYRDAARRACWDEHVAFLDLQTVHGPNPADYTAEWNATGGDDVHPGEFPGMWQNAMAAARLLFPPMPTAPQTGVVGSTRYVKHPDGTLVQHARIDVAYSSANAMVATWTFAVPFVDSDYSANATVSLTDFTSNVATVDHGETVAPVFGARSTDSVQVQVRRSSAATNSFQAGDTSEVHIMAVGRWY
jgi:hypothetical protein